VRFIDKLKGRTPPDGAVPDPISEPVDADLPQAARVEKLEEAERWTARKKAEVDAIKREYARYELELQLETGTHRGATRHEQARGEPQR
jgi:hypothetical protein